MPETHAIAPAGSGSSAGIVRPKLLRVAYPTLIIGLCLAVFGHALNAPFVFDDIPSIPDNPHIRTLWPPWAAATTDERGDITIAGRPEVNFYWLFEALAALLVDLGGIPLFATVCTLLYGFIPVLLYQRMLRIGAGMLPAFVLTLTAYTVLLSHALARPPARD